MRDSWLDGRYVPLTKPECLRERGGTLAKTKAPSQIGDVHTRDNEKQKQRQVVGAPTRMTPLKLAIIGGGPSSFYVASRLLSLLPKDERLKIHIYDRLWAPHGLVRYGVAPDHPEVKVRITPLRLSLSKCDFFCFSLVRTARTSLHKLRRTLACASLEMSR